jgi:hypothetical protein
LVSILANEMSNYPDQRVKSGSAKAAQLRIISLASQLFEAFQFPGRVRWELSR